MPAIKRKSSRSDTKEYDSADVTKSVRRSNPLLSKNIASVKDADVTTPTVDSIIPAAAFTVTPDPIIDQKNQRVGITATAGSAMIFATK